MVYKIKNIFKKYSFFVLLVTLIYGKGVYAHLGIETPFVHFETRDGFTVIMDPKKETIVCDDCMILPKLVEQQIDEDDDKTMSQSSWVQSVGQQTKSLTWSATKLGGKATWYVLESAAEWVLRTALAYNVAYYNTDAIEWGVAKGAGIVATLALGPAAAIGAEAAARTTLKVGHLLMPGFEGMIAGAALPVIKPLTDFTINHTPDAVKAVARGTQSIINTVGSTARAAKPIAETVIDKGVSVIKTIANGTQKAWNSGKKTAESLWESSKIALGTAATVVKEKASETLDVIKDTASKATKKIASAAQSVWSFGKKAFASFWG